MFKILVATDGSLCARKAAEYAGFLARQIDDAEITILGVIDAGVITRAAGASFKMPAGLSVEMERAVQEVLQDTKQRLASIGRKVHACFEHGIPAQVVCEIAETGKFDLIVMGSRGHGHIAGILLGSVSDKVLHKARVPVLIMRTKAEKL